MLTEEGFEQLTKLYRSAAMEKARAWCEQNDIGLSDTQLWDMAHNMGLVSFELGMACCAAQIKLGRMSADDILEFIKPK